MIPVEFEPRCSEQFYENTVLQATFSWNHLQTLFAARDNAKNLLMKYFPSLER